MQSQPIRVFLCHSSGDRAAVRGLYRRLKADGFLPWLDEENLIAGQDWEFEIRKAVRQSDAVVVCLSRDSINKTGFIQKELKYALDVADEQIEGSIFMIPVRLEECDVPERLAKWHWINYFEDGGHERLVQALRAKRVARSAQASSDNSIPPRATGAHVGRLSKSDVTSDAKHRVLLSGLVWLLVPLIFAVLFLYSLVWEAQTLSALGLSGYVFYLALVLVALSVAVGLFCFLKSYAFYKGTAFGGGLRLGGAEEERMTSLKAGHYKGTEEPKEWTNDRGIEERTWTRARAADAQRRGATVDGRGGGG